MKKLVQIGLLTFLFIGCEDVIEIDAPAEPPRLSVDALIRIDESEPITTAIVKVGLTSSFFESIEAAKVKQIAIQNTEYKGAGPLDENFIVLTETAPGQYEGSKKTSFFTSGNVELSIQYKDQLYKALTQYVPAVPIDKLEEGEGALFTGNETEILVSFTDNPERNDFYLFDFDFNEYLVTEDEFYQGQTFQFSYFYDEGIESSREIYISILGVDEPFYNYMNQLLVQSDGNQGPFQTPAATVRGNIINVTNIDNIGSIENVDDSHNFALGYFAVCQTFTKSIIIE